MGDLGKIIVAKGFEWLPKVQKIAQSGHTVWNVAIAYFLGLSQTQQLTTWAYTAFLSFN